MPVATPESAVNKDYLGNEKDVGAVHLAYPIFEALVNLVLRISNQLAHVKGLFEYKHHVPTIRNNIAT